MKYGVSLFPLRPQQIIDVALCAEELGFDSLWLGEHVVTPVKSDSRFPYAGEDDDSHEAFHANLPFYDPYAVLAYLAAITKSVKLAVSVSIVPLHDPFHLARSVTTLDLFSKGRFMLGAGGGWLKEEFEILGRDFETRGKRFDETLDVMVSLFNNDVTEYDGVALKVPAIGMSPKPDTRPHPPFVFGGHAKPALRRAAHRGNGWLASELSPEEIAPLIGIIKRMREEAGRVDVPFEISCAVMGDPSDELIAQYEAVGVDRLVVRPWMRGRDAVANLTTLAGRIL
ncbi:TIGR03619 family F420-dependent LLM class oxidoreductase (plasmid) [Sphingobium sp. SJ10-10]|uniref:TIGR03619 family F420-dependent LLM class oxidoreductase n=1 Tax=Sphingobium sp. SJ10-10 TaxID=3114999 RepID=UPI002E1792F9|nr:TIGR03619 family F420-dependent LLM class oxidoreductase [Sphingobium sp. SJ10-10]